MSNAPHVRLYGPDFLDDLAQRAADAPRRRLNANLHDSTSEPCQRIFNALCPDSYVQAHRHLHPDKSETVLILRGRFGLVCFDDAGTPVETHLLRPLQTATVPSGVWHAWFALDPDSVFFEAKAGPYLPLDPAERAPFAPPEGSPEAPAYLARLQALVLAAERH